MTVHESWRIIEAALEKHARPIHAALRKPAGDSAIAKLAKVVPADLPPDFVESLKIHDGLNDSYLGRIRLFDYNALLPASAIIDEHTMMCALQSDSDFGGSQAGGDPSVRNDTHWRPGWVPIMDADGDKLILDLDPAPGGTVGQVFEWSNSGSRPLRVLAPSFEEWLGGIAEALDKGRFRLDEHNQIWLGGGGA